MAICTDFAFVYQKRNSICQNIKHIGLYFLYGIIILASGVFIVFALGNTVQGNIALLVILGLISVCIIYKIFLLAVSRKAKDKLRQSWSHIFNSRKTKRISSVVLVVAVVALYGYILVDVSSRRPHQLISLAGLLLLVTLSAIFSTSPCQIQWRVVLSGVTCQLLLGLVTLRWPAAQEALMWFGNQITAFIDFAKEGAIFVFGEAYLKHPFAMEVMSMLVYFSAVVALLGHIGVLSVPFRLIGYFIKFIIGASAAESFVAASNIFLGPNDSVLLISTMVPDLSISELHTIMASGMATIGGGTLAAFVKFGVPASHLVSASIMSAPAVLAVTKLLLPETRRKSIQSPALTFNNRRYNNALEALSAGASGAVPMVAAILVTLISFLSCLDFLNTTLAWLGQRVGIQGLSFQVLCGYLLTPVAFLMGVSWSDSHQVAALIGLKTIVNEFVAYTELSKLISNRKQGLHPRISERSEVMAVYALCGYSNVGTMASLLGFMIVLAPKRQAELSRIAFRSLCSATVACLMTGCVAGLLTEE